MSESSNAWMSHVTREWVTSHMNESCHIWMNHVIYEWIMSHMTSHIKWKCAYCSYRHLSSTCIGNIATRCNTLQHTATHCNTLQYTRQYCKTHPRVWYCNILQHTATPCTILQDTLTPLILQHTATHCNSLDNTAWHTHACFTPLLPLGLLYFFLRRLCQGAHLLLCDSNDKGFPGSFLCDSNDTGFPGSFTQCVS